MFLRMLLGSILRRKARTLTVFLAIMVGTGIASALINFYYDVEIKMTREFRAYGANLMVAPAGGAPDVPRRTGITSDQTSLLMNESTRQALQRVTAGYPILAQVPYYYTVGQVGSDYLTVVGADVEGLHRLNSWWKVEGPWMTLNDSPPACMIGRRVARRLGIIPGQELVLKAGGAKQEYRLRVSGIVETGAEEDQQIFVALATAWAMGGQAEKVNTVALNALGSLEDIKRLAQAIEQQIPALRAKPILQIAQSEGRILARIKWMMVMTIAVILIITAICAMTTLAAMVLERGKEVAVMKALGAGRVKISQLLLSEVLALGGAGGFTGYVVGLGVAHILERSIFKSSITIRPVLLPIIILIACGILILASLIAVRRALHIQPAILLKGE